MCKSCMNSEPVVLVVGLGSIGRRHLKALVEKTKPKVIRLLSHKPGDERVGEDSPFAAENVRNWDDALAARPEFAIVANPTACHVETASRLTQHDIPFMLEKPVSNRIEGLDSLRRQVHEKALPVQVGFQLRQHPGYSRFIDVVKSGRIGRPLSLRGHVGQYLPEWRSEGDYRRNYSADREMGGGVIFDLCHEIDVAISALGAVKKVTCVCGHYSDLEINSEDIAELILEHVSGGISQIHLNYLEPRYRWTTSVLGTDGEVTWDYGWGYVALSRRDGAEEKWLDPRGFERDDLFRLQMQQWLDVLAGKGAPAVDLDAGVEVTKVAIAAHESAARGKRVTI